LEDTLIRSGAIFLLVIDSVAALTPKAEIEGEMGDSQMGLQARLMSKALRKLTGSISKAKTCCIFINQLRDKIGVMFGNPETTTGGNALKFTDQNLQEKLHWPFMRLQNVRKTEELQHSLMQSTHSINFTLKN
jgi:RecA/RadA recombinase